MIRTFQHYLTTPNNPYHTRSALRKTLLTRFFRAANLRPSAEAQWLRLHAGNCLYRGFRPSTQRWAKPERRDHRLSNVSPEVRQQELAAAGFTEYPRVEEEPVSIGWFKRNWINRLNTGQVADSEDYTGMQNHHSAGNCV